MLLFDSFYRSFRFLFVTAGHDDVISALAQWARRLKAQTGTGAGYYDGSSGHHFRFLQLQLEL